LTARKLGSIADVSAAMISLIESFQVSPSISKLSVLAQSLIVLFLSLFRKTTDTHADINCIESGEGLTSNRFVDGHSHKFINLSFHNRKGLQFEARKVTLLGHSAKPPVYVGYGVVFVHALEDQAVLSYVQC
jgi:transcriptional regulator with XRE-family HTH domain